VNVKINEYALTQAHGAFREARGDVRDALKAAIIEYFKHIQFMDPTPVLTREELERERAEYVAKHPDRGEPYKPGQWPV
jgi:hypothetical protein